MAERFFIFVLKFWFMMVLMTFAGICSLLFKVGKQIMTSLISFLSWIGLLALRQGKSLLIYILKWSLPGLWRVLKHLWKGWRTFAVALIICVLGAHCGARLRFLKRHLYILIVLFLLINYLWKESDAFIFIHKSIFEHRQIQILDLILRSRSMAFIAWRSLIPRSDRPANSSEILRLRSTSLLILEVSILIHWWMPL